MRALRVLAGLLLIPLLAVPAAAGGPRGVEITPFAGFRFGGGFEDNVTGVTLDVGESEAFGLAVDYALSPETEGELFYSFQRTDVEAGGPTTGPLLDLDIHYIHLGGTYLFPGPKATPFIAGGLGLSIFNPRGAGLDSETRFSMSLGGGAKIPFSKTLGVRLEGRGFMTLFPESTSIFCVSSGGAACSVSVQGSAFFQFMVSAGLIFSL